MSTPPHPPTLGTLLQGEWQQLTRINASDRLWQMALAASIAAGGPLLVAAWAGQLALGLAGSLGAMAFVYVTGTPMHHRMVTMMACAFGLLACWSLGLVCRSAPELVPPVIALCTMLVTMVCRYYDVAPPGPLFFVMAFAIAAYLPSTGHAYFETVGVFAVATLYGVLVGFLYSLLTLRLRAPAPVPPRPTPYFDTVIVDPVVIGFFVGLSLLLAQALGFDRPYWAPVSCLAVIQGVTLRAVWNRQLQRMLGTAAGLLLTWGLLGLPLNAWSVAATMMALIFAIESLIVRHYALAVAFITPMAILLAEAARLGLVDHAALMHARLQDTALGCAVGLLGGFVLHQPRMRAVVAAPLRWLVPARLRG